MFFFKYFFLLNSFRFVFWFVILIGMMLLDYVNEFFLE